MKLFWIVTITVLCFLKETQSKNYLEDLTISTNEKKILDKFRERVIQKLPHEYMQQDVYLIRWLRNAYFNMDKAEAHLNANLRWRKVNNMDFIHQEDWSDYVNDYKYNLKGRTRDGKPILYVNFGFWDLRKAAISGKQERFHRYIDKVIDETYNLIRELGEKQGNVSQTILLLNIDGFNLVEHGCLQCIPIILGIIRTYEDHYPGQADGMFVINAPAVADPVIRIARAALHPLTNRILEAYGTNKAVYRRRLALEISDDQLPTDLGGKLQTDSGKDSDYDYLTD